VKAYVICTAVNGCCSNSWPGDPLLQPRSRGSPAPTQDIVVLFQSCPFQIAIHYHPPPNPNAGAPMPSRVWALHQGSNALLSRTALCSAIMAHSIPCMRTSHLPPRDTHHTTGSHHISCRSPTCAELAGWEQVMTRTVGADSCRQTAAPSPSRGPVFLDHGPTSGMGMSYMKSQTRCQRRLVNRIAPGPPHD
jgi:hypothetical protein